MPSHFLSQSLRSLLAQILRSRLLPGLCLLGAGVLPVAVQPPAQGAEAVVITYGQLEFPLTLEALETFAATGEATGGLAFYARFFNDEQLANFRRLLQQRYDITPTAVSQLTYSQLGQGVLQRLGQVVRTEARLEGFSALRSALVLAATDPDGLTMLNVIRYFPSTRIRISAAQLVELNQIFTAVVDYRDAALRALNTEMQAEIAAEPPLNWAQLPIADLSQAGSTPFEQRTLTINRDRLSLQGVSVERSFQVALYLPQGLDQPAPVVVISHGLGSSPDAFAYLGKYLASYGFAVVIPQHLGSDEVLKNALFSGLLGSDIRAVEFVDRPLDISYTLDQLEALSQSDPTLTGRMDLQNVGAIGHSFGGYTVLALAGAKLNVQRASQTCDQLQLSLNAAPVLQCLIQTLPDFNYRLRDSRVKAVFAISPIASLVLGPESLSQIQIPTMLMGGSADFVASVLQEQIHPFTWLTTPDKYLAITIPSGHTYADATDGGAAPAPGTAAYLLSGPAPALGREYVQELSLAFMQTYVAKRPAYQAYLSPAYVQSISQEPLQLNFVRSLTPIQLEQAYGGPPPVAIVPPPLVVDQPIRSQPILEEIAKTGVLRAAVRQDAFPFGYTDGNGQQAGFCMNLLNALATQLGEQLQTPVRLDIATISTPETRYDLVKNETVQVECGPNTIRQDVQGVAFSTPFFVTGTHLLTRSTDAPLVDPFSPLPNRRIGVLRGTTTETFVQQRYPDANIVEFGGIDGRTTGIQALASGALDVFAGDGILSLGELQQQNLRRSDFALLPDRPMTCDPYGLILPANDQQFETIVDDFIASASFRQLWDQQFSTNTSRYIFFNLDYCTG